nr:hypothetical protein HK105_004776 [Polyrhizophydium stewartii]
MMSETVVATPTPTPASSRRVRFSRSPLSFLSAAWLTPLMALGARRPLQLEDLPVLEGDATAAACAGIMDRFWQRLAAHQAAPTSTKPPSLFVAVAPSMALPVWVSRCQGALPWMSARSDAPAVH